MFVQDVLPAGVAYVSHTVSGTATCTTPSPGSGGTIGCYVDLPKWSSWTLTITVETSTPDGYTNQVTADTVVGKGRNDPDPSNNSASSTWAVVSGQQGDCLGCDVDVAVDKSAQLDLAAGTVQFALKLRVGSEGPLPLVMLTDTLEPAFAFVDWSTDSPGRIECVHDGSPAGGTVRCNTLPRSPSP